MNKNRIFAALLVMTMSVCALTACNAKEPGQKNDKLVDKTPESIGLVDENAKTSYEDVTAITGSTDINGKVVDAKGIKDLLGHTIYSTGLTDDGKTVYTTGKKDSKGNILYTKNQQDTFGNLIYYTGEYDKDGKLHLTQTNETPDYTSNEVPTTKKPVTAVTTSTTVNVPNPSDKKVDEVNCEYTKYFGGTGIDAFRDITATDDGGYVVAGISQSRDGDYNGISADWDYHTVIIKYSADGSVQWKYNAGGDGIVWFNDVIQLKDGSFIAAGQTQSKTGDFVKNSASNSAIIVRLKKDGTFMWKYVFPSDAQSTGEFISALAATPDGGFVAGGKAISESGFFTGTREGGTKAFLFKFDKNGNIKWRRILEGSKSNEITALAVNSDGEIYGTCVTMSSDGDFSGIRFKTIQASNSVLVKLSKNGELKWSQYLQGSGDSEYNAVAVTEDGGCVVGGTYSIYKKADGIYSMSYGKKDGYVIRYTSDGQVCWSRIIGGTDNDSITAIVAVEGGFAVVGQTESASGDFQSYKAGGETDGYIMYLNDMGKTTEVVRLNGSLDESVMDVAKLTDGSIAIAGWTKSNDQAFNGSGANKQYMGYVSRYTATVK